MSLIIFLYPPYFILTLSIELLLKKVGVASINESTIKIPWPIFRQLELRFIA